MGGDTPYVGQLLLVAFNFVPYGWLPCDGRLVSISEYETLFNLIGTTYGGDGQTTFGLPDLRGRVPVGMGQGTGQNYVLGAIAGVETVTLTAAQYPVHNHNVMASSHTPNSGIPQNNVPANGVAVYTNAAPTGQMAAATLGSQGTSGPHENRQPYLALSWIISPFGVYPTQN